MESAQLLSKIEALPAIHKVLVEEYVAFLYQLQKEDFDNVGRLSMDWETWYKGKMSKQPKEGIDKQLKELRDGWE